MRRSKSKNSESGYHTQDVVASNNSSSSHLRRCISSRELEQIIFEDNDDEAERIARREKNKSPKASTPSIELCQTSVSNLSSAELNYQISACIKLNAENKINDKNAFQLKMIDFLVFALRKQDPHMSNLQLASASLDASAKIYGCRVDKVHSDILKILGLKIDKKDSENENLIISGIDKITKKQDEQKKKKKKQLQIISNLEGLQANYEIYDPSRLINSQTDTQTSDLLYQANAFQHANQGIALNLYRDIILDFLPTIKKRLSKYLIIPIEEISCYSICPSYASFKFNDKFINNDKDLINHNNSSGDYHFDLEADVPNNDLNNDLLCDLEERFEVKCDKPSSEDIGITDFQDLISNNPNPNISYEYSYIKKNRSFKWKRPSHWKLKYNGAENKAEIISKKIKKRNTREYEILLTAESKLEAEKKFNKNHNPDKILLNNTLWSEDKFIIPEDININLKNFCTFFVRSNEFLELNQFSKNLKNLNDSKDNCDNFSAEDNNDLQDFNLYLEDDIPNQERISPIQDKTITPMPELLTGTDLNTALKLSDKIFTPYSQRAKKIDMHQLKKVIWKTLKKSSQDKLEKIENNIPNNDKIRPSCVSEIYSDITQNLSKTCAESLSPALAFVSLLHVAHEKNLKINQYSDLSDLNINIDI